MAYRVTLHVQANPSMTLDAAHALDFIQALPMGFDTIVGQIRFNELGEWATARMLLVQFQNVQGSGLDQYLTGHKQVILYPPQYKDGELEAPFAK